MSRPERVLVTGAAGFVGSVLVERLLDEGRRVVALDNFDPFYPEPQKRRNLERASSSSSFRLERGDIRDRGALERVFSSEPLDAVVHLAALAGVRPSLERPSDYADVNVTGTAALAHVALDHDVTRLVFASSSSVYGERAGAAFREGDPAESPISPYAATKRSGELLLHGFHRSRGLRVACARIFTAYGPRQRPDLAIRKFAERMLRGDPIPVFGDGSQQRDFTYVEDLVDGLVRMLDADLDFAILNLGAGRTVSLLEVIEALERALGVKARVEWLPSQPGDVSFTWADVGEAQRRIGYRPTVALETGIERFAAWLHEVS